MQQFYVNVSKLSHEFQSYLNEIAAYLHEIETYLMEIDIAFLGDRTVSRGIAYKENRKIFTRRAPFFIGQREIFKSQRVLKNTP